MPSKATREDARVKSTCYIWAHAPADRAALAAGFLRWRRDSLYKAEYRGISKPSSGHPRNHGSVRRPFGEEMERLYTIPMEVGLAPTPGVHNIRSTSFYGLSFVRVTFEYGIDYYFALQQAQISLLQNVSLPNNVQPQIQASSSSGKSTAIRLPARSTSASPICARSRTGSCSAVS